MSKTKAKTASKNNPTAREQAKEFTHNGQKIKPVKIITHNSTFFGAEYEGSGELVLGVNNIPLAWEKARSN